MSVINPATAVGEVLAAAAGEVMIVAPYIKIGAFRALLGKIKPSATLVCITRWLPEDIASGVCDLEILDALTSRPKSSLLVQPHLHAKYYRGDDRCLVGSANLTARGLGWATPANVELLVELSADFAGVARWEAALRASGVIATPELRDRIAEGAARLTSAVTLHAVPEVKEDGLETTPQAKWIPTCPVPERLWTVYRGGAEATMVSSAREAAMKDVRVLSPPPGLTQELFKAYISGILRQMPLMIEIDALASAGLTDAQAYEFLMSRMDNVSEFSAEQTWRTLKAWLIHFFPTTYRLETGQEVLIRGKELST